jgi:signal transduction histidine kinase/CheY-like chemotaxis protein
LHDRHVKARWLVAVAASVLALAAHALLFPMLGGASHLPIILAIAAISVYAGRGPATLVLAVGLGTIFYRLVDGSSTLPPSSLGRVLVLAGYLAIGLAIIALGDLARRHASGLRQTRREFDDAMAAAEIGTWTLEYGARTLRLSNNVGPMIGREYGFQYGTLQAWRADVHPDDASRAEQVVRGAGGEHGYEVRYRIRTPDGHWRWLLVRGKITRQGDNGERIATGIVLDVTALQAAEQAQRHTSDELRTLLDIVPVGVAIANDPECRQIHLSPRLARLLDVENVRNASYTGDEKDRLPYRCMRDGEDVAGEDLPMQRAARTGQEVRDEELELHYDDGRLVHLLVSAAPLFDAAGAVRGAIGVHTDVTALKAAQAELERVGRQKDVFLATLAHELRNPLAPVRYAATLLRTRPTADVVREVAPIIERQVAQMSQLLEELLDVSRITRNVIEIRREPVDLARVVQHEIDCARPRAAELGQSFDAHVEPVWVRGDETRLHQVVSNLLSNATKFTPRGGRVEVRLMPRESGEVELMVRDDGIGIPREQLAQVFELFSQVHRPGSAQSGGLGIGLAVARRLVELHGGRITAASDGPGRGARFTVRLPAIQSPAMSSHELTGPGAGLPQRVLVCDDNVDAADSLATLLRLHGVTVEVAYDGQQAQRKFATFHPEVALLDLGLPDMAGTDVARWIRAQPRGADARLVAVTGWGQPADRDRTAAAGFDHHLVKPVDVDKLLVLLGHLDPRSGGFQPAVAYSASPLEASQSRS